MPINAWSSKAGTLSSAGFTPSHGSGDCRDQDCGTWAPSRPQVFLEFPPRGTGNPHQQNQALHRLPWKPTACQPLLPSHCWTHWTPDMKGTQYTHRQHCHSKLISKEGARLKEEEELD